MAENLEPGESKKLEFEKHVIKIPADEPGFQKEIDKNVKIHEAKIEEKGEDPFKDWGGGKGVAPKTEEKVVEQITQEEKVITTEEKFEDKGFLSKVGEVITNAFGKTKELIVGPEKADQPPYEAELKPQEIKSASASEAKEESSGPPKAEVFSGEQYGLQQIEKKDEPEYKTL